MQYRRNSKGFIHYAILFPVAAVVIIGAIFVFVKDHHQEPRYTLVTPVSSTSKMSNLGEATATPKANTSLSTNAGPAPTTQPASNTGPAANTPTSSTGNNTPSTSPVSNPPVSNPAPQPTPLSVLTSLIAATDQGATMVITSNVITVPGPVTNAQARPIVFSLNGQLYFAYRQGIAPDFSTTPDQTASTMAIVKVAGFNPTTEQGHLNKAGVLVDENSMGTLVGYSQGGD